MKTKFYLTVAIAAGVLLSTQSCTKVYQHGLIKLADPVVEASSDIECNIQTKGISVFASKDRSTYFDNKRFYYRSGWNFDFHDHWSKGDYKFVAVCPYKRSDYEWDPAASSVSFDFRYGYPYDGLCMTSHSERNYDGYNNNPIEFKMEHVNCRLVLKVRNRTNSDYIKINDCFIQDIRFKGKVTVSPSGTVIAVDDSLAKKSTNQYKSTIRDLLVENGSTKELFPEQITVAPQSTGSSSFTFTYSDNSSTTPVMFYFNDLETVTGWETGKTYIYTVDIFNTSAEINVSVQDWIDININL